MPTMPAPIAYTAARNASNSENEPRMSNEFPRRTLLYCASIQDPAGRAGSVPLDVCPGCGAPGVWLGTASYLDAHFLRQFALHRGLCAIFERIRKRVAPDVRNSQILALFSEHKINGSRHVRNRSILHVAGDAHALMQRYPVKCRKLRNRMVVGLALREADVS